MINYTRHAKTIPSFSKMLTVVQVCLFWNEYYGKMPRQIRMLTVQDQLFELYSRNSHKINKQTHVPWCSSVIPAVLWGIGMETVEPPGASQPGTHSIVETREAPPHGRGRRDPVPESCPLILEYACTYTYDSNTFLKDKISMINHMVSSIPSAREKNLHIRQGASP